MSLEESDKAAAAVLKTPNRVTLEQLESKVAEKHFVTAAAAVGIDYGRDWDAHYGNQSPPLSPLEVTTLCIVVTTNGFTFIGKSAPADPGNFDAELGKKLAYEDVLEQLWPFEGYLLRDQLSKTTEP